MLTQLAEYGVGWWLLFACVALSAARIGRFWGIVIGHILIAVIIGVLDVRWIQSEMHRPGWNGQPDQDGIFVIGVAVRVVLINVALLPLGIIGWWSRTWFRHRQTTR